MLTREVKAHPILFSGPMVRALLDGRKTQTRRVVRPAFGKKHPIVNLKDHGIGEYSGEFNDPASWGYPCAEDGNDMPLAYWLDLCPYGQPGDLLWVRETWGIVNSSGELSGLPTFEYEGYKEDCTGPFFKGRGARLEYAADGGDFPKRPGYRVAFKKRMQCAGRWRCSIHMPRWASRLTLEMAGVRVERLQDISEADAILEGMFQCESGFHWFDPRTQEGCYYRATWAYEELWESINGPGSWDANPWVWVLEFKVHQVNVDALLKARAA
jgi:hypothetical protein